MKHSTLLIASLIFLIACNSNQAPVKTIASSEDSKPFSVIVQPLKALGPALLTLVVDNAKGLLHKTEKGSVLMIPKDAFVNEDGSVVTGKVDVEYKEMFTPADIILSGIPMNVKNSEGQIAPFISDGMFTFQAGCNGKQVKLAEGKTISVSTPSHKTNDDFQYWYFNETKGEWESTGKREEVYNEEEIIVQAQNVNPELAKTFSLNTETQKAIDVVRTLDANGKMKEKPKAPESYNSKDFVFTITDTYNNYPELKEYKNVLWKPVLDLDKKDQLLLNQSMSSFGANISLNCINEDNQLYSIGYGKQEIQVRPVFIGKDKAKAEKRYKERLNTYMNEVKNQEKAAEYAQKTSASFAKTYNLFKVTSMGVYNCDRFYSYKGTKKNYTFKTNTDLVDQHVFAVLSNNQGVIALSSAYKQGSYYNLPTAEIVGFVHTDPKGDIYVSSHKPEETKDVNSIELSFRQKTPESPDAFAQIINSL